MNHSQRAFWRWTAVTLLTFALIAYQIVLCLILFPLSRIQSDNPELVTQAHSAMHMWALGAVALILISVGLSFWLRHLNMHHSRRAVFKWLGGSLLAAAVITYFAGFLLSESSAASFFIKDSTLAGYVSARSILVTAVWGGVSMLYLIIGVIFTSTYYLNRKKRRSHSAHKGQDQTKQDRPSGESAVTASEDSFDFMFEGLAEQEDLPDNDAFEAEHEESVSEESDSLLTGDIEDGAAAQKKEEPHE